MFDRRFAVVLAGLLCTGPLALGQQVLRDGFSAKEPVWIKGEADARHTILAHSISDAFAHSPPSSEYFRLQSELGERILFDYPVPRLPLSEETSISLWVRASKPGVQLRARLVLPHERHPERIDEPLTTFLDGGKYQLTGRWQKLQLDRPTRTIKQQQALLATELRKPIDIRDAYIDRIMINLYTGPGEAEVWVDDLDAGPLPASAPLISPQPQSKPNEPMANDNSGNGFPAPQPRSVRPVVELTRDRLLVGGKPFFFRGIRDVGTPPAALRDAGFNTLWLDAQANAEQVNAAADNGLWLVPSVPETPPGASIAQLTGRTAEAQLLADTVSRHVGRFPASDAILFWDLGSGRASEQEKLVARTASLVRAADPQRPLTADVWDGLWPYSRHLDLVGVHRFPLMTSLELTSYRDWLNQRRVLARPGTFVWTWVQAHTPNWASELLHDRPPGAGPEMDDGPDPDQIQLLTYVALSAGCRGIGYWPDQRLADPRMGRDRLLALALLNQELQMLEPLLLSLTETPTWIPAYRLNADGKGRSPLHEVQAAVMRGDKGILVTPVWIGNGAQYVPGQAAAANVVLTVPLVPPTATAWKVTPGEVRMLPTQRETGGVTVTVPEFGLSTAIVFTNDISLVVKWQDLARRSVRVAARWSRDLAAAELERVERIHRQLETVAPPLPDAEQLLTNARERLASTRRAFDEQNYQRAYLDAQRTIRPLRILMRAHWDNAVRTIDLPVSSPYAVSFASLPRHWQLWQAVRSRSAGPDALVGGDFELNPVPGERKLPLGEAQRKRKEESEAKPAPAGSRPVVRGQSPDGAAPARPAAADALAVRPLPRGWRVDQVTLDDVLMQARVVNSEPSEGRDCLELKVEPKAMTTPSGKSVPPPTALERTYLSVSSPEARLPAGTLVRISAWVRIPGDIQASADGAMMIDSISGEPLAVRLTDGTNGWRKISVYRRVPASERVAVTLALTGLGTVYFDDVRIEPLQ